MQTTSVESKTKFMKESSLSLETNTKKKEFFSDAGDRTTNVAMDA